MIRLSILSEIDQATVNEVSQALRSPGPVHIEMNSPGGSATAGMAIHSMLSARSGVTVEILGLAGSIASIVAMAADDIIIAESGFMMIHKPWSISAGDAEELRKTAGTLDKVEESLVNIYAKRTGQDSDRIRAMMAEETWFNAEEAVEFGFADRIVTGTKAVALADLSRFENVPEALNSILGEGNMDKETKENVTFSKEDIQAMIDASLKAAYDKPLGRKTEPNASISIPAIFARGMKRDGEPLNIGGYFRGVLSGNWKNAEREREIYNAMTTGSEGAGLIPERIAAEIWMELLERNALTQAGAQIVTLAQAGVAVPYESTTPSAAWVAEGTEISDSGGAISNQALTAHKIGFLREVTNEMLQDAPAAADSYIRQQLLNALARGLNAGFLNGTGASNQPTGLFTGTPTYAVDKTGVTLDYDMLMEAYWTIVGNGGIPGNIRAIMPPDAALYLDKAREDTGAGAYLQGSVPVQIPRVVSSEITVTSGTPDSTGVLVGDFSQALRIYSFGPMRLDVDASAAFAKDAITFRLMQRVDLQVAYTDLLQRLDDVNLG